MCWVPLGPQAITVFVDGKGGVAEIKQSCGAGIIVITGSGPGEFGGSIGDVGNGDIGDGRGSSHIHACAGSVESAVGADDFVIGRILAADPIVVQSILGETSQDNAVVGGEGIIQS